MGFRIGIDIGGTFTDFVCIDDDSRVFMYKVLSAPENPAQAVFDGLRLVCADHRLDLEAFLVRVDLILHATTITTNALLTGSGPKVGLLTTKGFRDLLEMRRGTREKLYDNRAMPPTPLVPRNLRLTVEERINCQGEEVIPLSEKDLRDSMASFRKEGVSSLAVSFLHSYRNPMHEKAAGLIIESELPEAYVTLSCEILPEIRMYERTSTAVLNSYCGPLLNEYIQRLEDGLRALGFGGLLLIMQSNGGMMSPATAKKQAAHTLLSGPAAGAVAGVHYGALHGHENCITCDMGGTSFDVCLIEEGTPLVTTEGEVAGYRLMLPILNINTIGAGGGSIAWIDSGGLLRVGPHSAGARPGPACYGSGGVEPTVTDAYLVLGYLDPEAFFGGQIKLDISRARKAISERIAEPLQLDVIEAALGIYRVVNSNMTEAIRELTVERGRDPREFALVVAGGAGPIHACAFASELGMEAIIVPREPSGYTALGMLMSDIKHDYVRTYMTAVEKADLQEIDRLYSAMKSAAMERLRYEMGDGAMDFVSTMDLRYVGQYHEITLTVNEEQIGNHRLDDIEGDFHKRHDFLYGYSMPGGAVEIVNLRLTAIGKTPELLLMLQEQAGQDASQCLMSERAVFFEQRRSFVKTRVYDGTKLTSGNMVEGPAIVQHPNSTLVVDPAYEVSCDDFGNYFMCPKEKRDHHTKQR